MKKAEIELMWPQPGSARGCQKLEETRTDPPREALRHRDPSIIYLDFGLLTSVTKGMNFCCFDLPGLW